MEATAVLMNLMKGNRGMVEKALEGLSSEELAKRPSDDCNSIGWLVWHMARAEDGLVSAVDGSPQLWTKGWAEKCGMKSIGDASGFGHGAEELAAFQVPSDDALKGYWSAAERKTNDYFKSLSPQDLDKQVPSLASEGTTPLASYLQLIVNEVLVHGGQVAYLRGLHRGLGWYF